MYQNYEKVKTLNWEKIKVPKSINVSVLVFIVISVLTGHFVYPLGSLLEKIVQKPLLILAVPLEIVLYIVIHELIHGLLMKIFSGERPQYGFSGPFIFAKSESIFDKSAYVIITLAPMLSLGFVSLTLSFYLQGIGVWATMFIWIINLYFSRGDIQAVMALKDFPRTYAIEDNGESLQIYKPSF